MSHEMREIVVSVNGSERRAEVSDDMWLLGFPRETLGLIGTKCGCGYAACEACTVLLDGVPVRSWTTRIVRADGKRKEDFTQSSFRPAARMEVRAGLGSDGRLIAWDDCLASAGGRFSSTRDIETFYQSDFQRTRFTLIPSGVRVGSFRGLGSPINAFARESLMDELAYSAGVDPMTFRLRALGDRLSNACFDATGIRKRRLPML